MKFNPRLFTESERVFYVKPDERQVSSVPEYIDEFGEIAVHVNPTPGDIRKMVNKHRELRATIANNTLYVWSGPVEHFYPEGKRPEYNFYLLQNPKLANIYPDDIFQYESDWIVEEYNEKTEEYEEKHVEDLGITEFPDDFRYPGIVAAESNMKASTMTPQQVFKKHGKTIKGLSAVDFFVGADGENLVTIRATDGAEDGRFDKDSKAKDWVDFVRFTEGK